jgi:low affinity Fe/Cu permease
MPVHSGSRSRMSAPTACSWPGTCLALFALGMSSRVRTTGLTGIGEFFRSFARRSSIFLGSPAAFVTAIAVVVGWAILGPVYHYSDTWQLVINTGTTIVTFLMVFLMQNTQNRDSKAIQLKLDELLRGVKGARTGLVRLESLTEEELVSLEGEFEALKRSRPSVESAETEPPSVRP